MGIDFVRSRESHLTITHDAVYRKLYKVTEATSLEKGERVLVELTNGMYEHCIVISTDPLNLAPYEKKHYVREDQMYRGTFIPEYLRKDSVSPESAQGGSLDGSTSSGSDGTDEDGTDNNELINDDSIDDNGANDGYIQCTCDDECPCRENCGRSMIGHLGYDHIYCHCNAAEDDEVSGEETGVGEGAVEGEETSSTQTQSHAPVRPEDVPCFCFTCHKPCLSDCPYTKTLFDIEVPESVYPDEMFINCTVRLHKPAERKIAVFVDAEDVVGITHNTLVFDTGENEASFTKMFCGSDTVFTAQCEGHTVTKTVRMEGFPVVFDKFECDTHPIRTGQPLTLRLTLQHPVTGTEIVSLESNHSMVMPDKLVFSEGEQEKTFTAVIWETDNVITAKYDALVIACTLNEEPLAPSLPSITSLNVTDDIVVGETFTLHVHLDSATESPCTLYIELSDDTLVIMPATTDVPSGVDEVAVTGMFTHAGTETFTVTLGSSTQTVDVTC